MSDRTSDHVDAPRFLPVGDTGCSVQFGEAIDPRANAAAAALDLALLAAEIPGIVETVPSFRALLVVYEPEILPWDALEAHLRRLLDAAAGIPAPPPRRWSIPVGLRGALRGRTWEETAALLGLDAAQVVAAHTGADFRVYMLGFQPGLPNLGGLPRLLHISRRVVPRPAVPPRSVTIGGVQGAIMPMATLTGFYMLGRTPVRPFDRRRDDPALFRPGDAIRFRPIRAAEFKALEDAAEQGDLFAGARCEAPA